MIRSYEMLTFYYLFCLENRTKGDLSPKTRRKELQEPVQQFYDNFREVYLDLRKNFSQELQQNCQQQPQRTQNRKVAWT